MIIIVSYYVLAIFVFRMVDHDPGLKQEENYPLLKVDAGGGDSCVGPQAPLTTVSPGWTIASGRKHSWLNRWPG